MNTLIESIINLSMVQKLIHNEIRLRDIITEKYIIQLGLCDIDFTPVDLTVLPKAGVRIIAQ